MEAKLAGAEKRAESVPPHGSSDGSTIPWCWVSFPVLKYPRAGRRGAHRSSGRYTGRNAFAVSTRHPRAPFPSPCRLWRSATACRSADYTHQHRMMSDSAREMAVSSSVGRGTVGYPSFFSLLSTLVSASRSESNGKPLHIYDIVIYQDTCYWLPERVSRTVLIASIPVVVTVVEHRARKAFNDI